MRKGAKHSEESKRKISEAKKGTKPSEETRRKISEALIGKKRKPFTKETRRKMSESKKNGRSPFSEETRRKMSAIKQDIPLEEWNGYVSYEPYCNRFNFAMKERIRNQYLRTCVISGNSVIQEGRRLSVHHVDNNKQQGCDDIPWRLVPVTRAWNTKLQKQQACLLLNLLLINNTKAQINLGEN